MDFNQDYFALFGLQPGFAVDADQLDQAYRAVQVEIHPDRFAHAGEAEQRLAMQWATRVNEAYQTLKNPFERARYLLKGQGIDVLDANNTSMPAEFLIEQMEWREALAHAVGKGDHAALHGLEQDTRAQAKRLFGEIGKALDETRDFAAAAQALRKYRFLDKFLADIDAAYEELD